MMHAVTSRLLLPLLALPACSSRTEPTGALRTFLGEDLIRIIGGATRVTAFRIDARLEPRPARSASSPASAIEGHPVLATAPEQGPEFAARLARLLFDAANYDFERAKACEFTPGVVFRLWRGGEHA